MTETLIVLYLVGAGILFIRLNFTRHAKTAWSKGIVRYFLFLLNAAFFSVFWFIAFPVAYGCEVIKNRK